MIELEVKHIKTYLLEISEDLFKAYQFLALSNGQFDVDTFEVSLFPEGWWASEEPMESKRFDSFFAATAYIEALSPDLVESDIYEPEKAVDSLVEDSYRQSW
ncbi:hypothetical protein EI614_05645 [Vibrio parahaemolyticus]|nr:hypothetical protein [Vibrio parahaemolyticus]EJE4682714.1 hypothetical protein [Vibrio parahaemolyticus]